MSSFAKGMQLGMSAWDAAEQSKRQKVQDERAAKEFARKETEWARADQQRAEEDAAFKAITGLKEGVYDGRQLTFPEAVPGAEVGPVEAPQVGLAVPRRDATPMDYNTAMQGVALARRDLGTLNTLQTQGRQLKLDEGRRSEFSRLNSLDDEALANSVGGWFSKDGSGVPAMLTFDPNAKQFMFASQVPGLPSGTLSRSELINYAMGAWEAGNGDIEKGMRMQLDSVRTKRELDSKNEGRAATLANANYKLWDGDRNFGLKQKEAADLNNYRMGSLGIQAQGLNLRRAAMLSAQGQADAADAFSKKVDGVLEGYQSAMSSGNKEAAAIYAREYDQLRALASNTKGLKVPPSLSALVQAQRGNSGSGKPVKVAEEGEKYLVDGQLKISDGRGGYIAEDGVLPSMRIAALRKAGVPDNLIGSLQFTPDGNEVVTPGGVAYSLNEIPQMVADMKRLARNTAKVEELQKPPTAGGLSFSLPW